MTDQDEDEQRAEVAKKREDESVAELNRVEQVKWLMQHEPFCDFMWRVLEHCHVFASVWDSNYGRMSLLEGERNVGLWLLHELVEASPDRWLAMEQKANRKKSEERREGREKAARVRRS